MFYGICPPCSKGQKLINFNSSDHIVGIDLDEKGVRSNNYEFGTSYSYMVNNYETISSGISNFRTSLFSPTQLHYMNMKKQMNMCLLIIQFN
jgi:hypothetical protein